MQKSALEADALIISAVAPTFEASFETASYHIGASQPQARLVASLQKKGKPRTVSPTRRSWQVSAAPEAARNYPQLRFPVPLEMCMKPTTREKARAGQRSPYTFNHLTET